ncbi:MAG TPA: response regulator [Vineibacter sp.]|nr:response regulator [Vineibacter sp.]
MTGTAAADPSTAGIRPVILAVDDEEAIRRIAAQNLRRMGFDVIEASNADEALRVITDPACRIDLLFTDMRMPGTLSGAALADMAVRHQPTMRVLLTSGNIGSVADGTANRFPVLDKPYRRADLAAAVTSALAAAPPA